MILPLLDVDETRAELAAAERDLDAVLTPEGRIMAPERLVEKQQARRRYRDQVRAQLVELESGQALVEYLVVVALVALVAIVALRTTGTNVSSLLHKIAGDL